MQLRNYEGSLEIKIWPKRSNRWASWRTITVYMSWLRVSLLAVITYPGVWKWNIENNLLYEDFIWTQSCFGPRISNLSYIPFSILANIQCRHCSALQSGSNISSHLYPAWNSGASHNLLQKWYTVKQLYYTRKFNLIWVNTWSGRRYMDQTSNVNVFLDAKHLNL